jgi:transcriptional regulator with XRE-family HTH domain
MTRSPIALADHVAAAIRAELARRDWRFYQLAERLDVDETWVGRRLNRKSAITLDDLERIADALDMAPARFVPDAEPVGAAL